MIQNQAACPDFSTAHAAGTANADGIRTSPEFIQSPDALTPMYRGRANDADRPCQDEFGLTRVDTRHVSGRYPRVSAIGSHL